MLMTTALGVYRSVIIVVDIIREIIHKFRSEAPFGSVY